MQRRCLYILKLIKIMNNPIKTLSFTHDFRICDNVSNVPKNRYMTLRITGFRKFLCSMKENQIISSGYRIKKRESCDELTHSFRKKLRIDEDNIAENSGLIDSIKISNALILYKEPVPPINIQMIPKNVLNNILNDHVLISDSILAGKIQFEMENIFNSDYQESKDVDPDNNQSFEVEMELD